MYLAFSNTLVTDEITYALLQIYESYLGKIISVDCGELIILLQLINEELVI